jgi:hypothetical protein
MACSMDGRREKSLKGFDGKAQRDLEDRGTDGRMGLEWILGRLAGDVWSEFT